MKDDIEEKETKIKLLNEEQKRLINELKEQK